MDDIFQFKRFKVRHGQSSMKVGVDAVLIGAWGGLNATQILDVGCGCGVISLILAQRFPKALIKAIDIDTGSLQECSLNFQESPWPDRLSVEKIKFPDEIYLLPAASFDLIVSNPPYFNSGVLNPSTPREKARHQASLSVFSLLQNSAKLLKHRGTLSMIFPFNLLDEVLQEGEKNGFQVSRICQIRGTSKKDVKRVMADFIYTLENGEKIIKEELVLFNGTQPSEKHRFLCKDLYLKF